MRAQLRALLKPLEPSQHYRIEWLRSALNWSPIMPRDISLFYSRCEFFFQSRYMVFELCQLQFHFRKLSIVRSAKSISILYQIDWNMIVVTVFLLILNKIEFHLVQN